MKPVANKSDAGRRPIDLLGPDARRALVRSRKVFRRMASARSRLATTEEKLRDWERRVVSKGSSARRWGALLTEGLGILADSGGVQLEVRQEEKGAVEALRAGLAATRELADREGAEPLVKAARLLEQCERLRTMELSWLDAVLAQTHAILNLPGDAAPDQVLAGLEQHRKSAARLDTRRREAETLERRAIGFLTGTKLTESTVEPPDTDMPSRRKKTPPPEPPSRAAERVTGARADVEGRIAAFVEKLEVEHAEAMAEEVRLRDEVEERLSELRDERKAFEERVNAAEAAAEEARARLKENEASIAEERTRLEKEKSAMQARMIHAERERDEALVLVASLTRRLKTPGISQALDEEEGSGEEE
jgi:hypothetical protein